jgi:hypothetical protein
VNTQLYTVVWLDHLEAKIYSLNSSDGDPVFIHTNRSGDHLRHRANVPGAGHQGVDTEFFGRISTALEGSAAVLLTGPGTCKSEFRNYLGTHRRALLTHIAGMETLDHPSEPDLLAMARTFFKAHDPRFEKLVQPGG